MEKCPSSAGPRFARTKDPTSLNDINALGGLGGGVNVRRVFTAGHFAGVDPRTLEHVLVTEYGPDAAIGWHRDRPIFADVIGVSLLSPCTFRFRKQTGAGWQRSSVRVAPGSAYLLRGPARTDWEHSIPGVESLRYSITFRNFRAA